MLFIFRKLRRSFFQPGKAKTYIAYAIGEIALIMVGILLALQVSDWSQEREDRAEEREILLRLKAEFEENQERLQVTKDGFLEVSESMDALLNILRPESTSIPDDLLHQYLS